MRNRENRSYVNEYSSAHAEKISHLGELFCGNTAPPCGYGAREEVRG
jgi:hypothetical protein